MVVLNQLTPYRPEAMDFMKRNSCNWPEEMKSRALTSALVRALATCVH